MNPEKEFIKSIKKSKSDVLIIDQKFMEVLNYSSDFCPLSSYFTDITYVAEQIGKQGKILKKKVPVFTPPFKGEIGSMFGKRLVINK